MIEESQPKCFQIIIKHIPQNETMNTVDNDYIHYLFTLCLIVAAFVFLSNAMLIYGLYKTNKRLPLTKKLFIYLSIVDITTACIEVIAIIVIFYTENISCMVGSVIVSVLYGLNCVSFELLLDVSVLRYLSITRPFLRIRNIHKKVVLVIELVCAVCMCITYYLLLQNVATGSLTAAAGVFLIMIITVLTINILSYKAMNQMSEKRKKYKKTNEIDMKSKKPCHISPIRDLSSNKSDRRKKAAIATLIIITVSYLVFSLPITAFTIIGSIKSFSASNMVAMDGNPIIVEWILHYIQITYTGLNATIFILRSREIRRFYKCKCYHLF